MLLGRLQISSSSTSIYSYWNKQDYNKERFIRCDIVNEFLEIHKSQRNIFAVKKLIRLLPSFASLGDVKIHECISQDATKEM